MRYFVEVARHGGFLQASRRIHVSQPALSKAIQQLETELGARLLVRSRPGVPARLTPSGELALQHAKALLERSALMQAEVSLLNHQAAGVLRLGLPPLGGISQVAAALTEFQQRYPQVELQLLENGGAELEQAVRQGEAELAVSLQPDSDDLDWHPICAEPLLVALPAGHPLAGHRSLLLSDLAQQPWVRLHGASLLNRRIEQCCPDLDLRRQQVAQSANLAFCLSLIAAGAGLMVLPKPLAQHHIPLGVATVPLDCPQLRWQLAAIWRKDAALSAPARQWLALLASRTEPAEA
ncbi:LysR family transcriptional regulator [Chromobacterium sp. IIBBL 290-4]|uniref:LysR family transcriptional regulator n=1 Tax=Chromobacterium sp. IIBBL 290-4 TaxID=2953890 RepID=UPI0020B653CF|nr:LysR family transcriptional regulator [Chromobacterium sp. IIBBL 290-4]UTH74700.1 LysR family transcriptional regulator [Chromobacterium sp. IIBBL 290-4]